MTNSKRITLTPRDMIAGLPAMRVRLALIHGKNILWPLCADQLAVDPQTALTVLDRMIAEGYLIPDHSGEQIRMWTRTRKGDRLARAIVPVPIPREEALQQVTRTINFVNSINRLPLAELDEHVVGIHVIGELLSGNGPTIPHLELAIDVGSKIWSPPDPKSESISADGETVPIAWGSAIHHRLVEFEPTICLRMRAVG